MEGECAVMEDVIKIEVIGNDKEANIIKKENMFILITSLLLGILFNILFFKSTLGISYPVFILTFYLGVLWNIRKRIITKINFGWLLSVPIILLSLTYLIFTNEVFIVLNFMGIPILILVQIILITGINLHEWYCMSFIQDIMNLIFFYIIRNISKPFVYVTALMQPKAASKKNEVAMKIFIGLCISFPLLLVIILLLSSADQVFAKCINYIPSMLEYINPGEYIARAIIIFIAAILLFSLMWSLVNSKAAGAVRSAGVDKDNKRVFDPVVIITILFTINIIYLLFTLIQFKYLFGQLLPKDFSYSEYARRGFFELNIVTLINLSILLCFISFTKKISKITGIFICILNSLLVFSTLVMLLSAHLRMSLYEDVYGYTYLRVLTHAFMAFLFVIFIITFIKIWKEKISLLKPYIIAALIAYVLINYMNIDVFIAGMNIDRLERNNIDISYLTSLSCEAVPQLTRLLDSKDDTISNEMENYLYLKKKELSETDCWQSFNISRYNAGKILSKYELHYQASKASAGR
jgi:hypothetical protein